MVTQSPSSCIDLRFHLLREETLQKGNFSGEVAEHHIEISDVDCIAVPRDDRLYQEEGAHTGAQCLMEHE